MKLIYRLLFSLFCLVAAFSIGSCSSELDFSTNPADKLSFSADTIRFDTVFSQIGSSTRQFRVFNRNNKPLKIESIDLAGGDNSAFSIVVDGRRGTHFDNVEIDGKDSMFVFVEVKVDPQDKNNPVLIADSLLFNFNGNHQRIRLEAYGQDVIILQGKTIKIDTTLTGERPFLIYDSLIVAKGSKLNLNPGAKLFFHNKAFCRIDGQISSKGTVQDPVIFRGDRMDNLLPDLPYDLYSGQWEGVSISTGSYDNVMEHTQIRNGIYALRLDSANIDNQKVTLLNCKFTNVSGTVLQSYKCKMDAYGCEFSNGGDNVVDLIGGKYTFVHCTLLSSYLFANSYTKLASPTALKLSNYRLETFPRDIFSLEQADFTNCIIYGSRNNEINFDLKTNNSNNLYKYHFEYCLFKDDGTDDADFVSILWDKAPKFINVGEDYRFDLRLDSLSDAIDAGNYGAAQICPTDMLGDSRYTDSKPDLGAYERIQK